MKFLKILLISLGVLVGIFLLATLMLPSKYTVERSCEIKAPDFMVFYYFSTPRYWEFWDDWMKMDLKQVRSYNEVKTGPNATYHWDSKVKNLGSGTLTITDAVPFSEVKISLQMDQMDSKSQGVVSISKDGKITKVKWTWTGEMTGFKKWFNLMMDKVLGASFDRSLANLKRLLESFPKTNATIGMRDLEPQKYYYIEDSCGISPQETGEKLGKAYNGIASFLQSKKMMPSGRPIYVNISFDESKRVFRAGFPVTSTAETTTGRIKAGVLPGGKAVRALQTGPFERTPFTYREMRKYMNEMELTQREMPWEVYLDSVPTYPMQIATEIFIPVK